MAMGPTTDKSRQRHLWNICGHCGEAEFMAALTQEGLGPNRVSRLFVVSFLSLSWSPVSPLPLTRLFRKNSGEKTAGERDVILQEVAQCALQLESCI